MQAERRPQKKDAIIQADLSPTKTEKQLMALLMLYCVILNRSLHKGNE